MTDVRDTRTLTLDGAPRRDVALMIEIRNNDFVASLPAAPQPARDVKRQRRHIRAEHDLVGRRIDQIRRGHARRMDHRVGLFARRIRPIRIGVVLIEVVGHGPTNRQGHLGAPRPVEVRDGPTIVAPRQGGKLLSNRHDRHDYYDQNRHATAMVASWAPMTSPTHPGQPVQRQRSPGSSPPTLPPR